MQDVALFISISTAALILVVWVLRAQMTEQEPSEERAARPKSARGSWSGRLEVDPKRLAGLSEYPGTYTLDIVGESHYQAELEEICGGRVLGGHNREEQALLLPYQNPHDAAAVGVLMGEEKLVGHLSREDDRQVRRAMIAMGLDGCTLKVPALIVGGWDNGDGRPGHFGVKLDLPATMSGDEAEDEE